MIFIFIFLFVIFISSCFIRSYLFLLPRWLDYLVAFFIFIGVLIVSSGSSFLCLFDCGLILREYITRLTSLAEREAPGGGGEQD